MELALRRAYFGMRGLGTCDADGVCYDDTTGAPLPTDAGAGIDTTGIPTGYQMDPATGAVINSTTGIPLGYTMDPATGAVVDSNGVPFGYEVSGGSVVPNPAVTGVPSSVSSLNTAATIAAALAKIGTALQTPVPASGVCPAGYVRSGTICAHSAVTSAPVAASTPLI